MPYVWKSLGCTINGYEDIDPIVTVFETQTLDYYLIIINTTHPLSKLPDADSLRSITGYLNAHQGDFKKIQFFEMADILSQSLAIDDGAIKGALYCFLSAGCFLKEPEEGKLSEQQLSFIDESIEDTLNKLTIFIYSKIELQLGVVDESIFSELIGKILPAD